MSEVLRVRECDERLDIFRDKKEEDVDYLYLDKRLTSSPDKKVEKEPIPDIQVLPPYESPF